MTVPVLEGITPRTVASERLTTRVLFAGPDDGIPVLLLHGNFSNATWWEETLVTLPPQYRGIAPDQRPNFLIVLCDDVDLAFPDTIVGP